MTYNIVYIDVINVRFRHVLADIKTLVTVVAELQAQGHTILSITLTEREN